MFTVMVVLLMVGFIGAMICMSMENNQKAKELCRRREEAEQNENNE